jgi:hypothetical protein
MNKTYAIMIAVLILIAAGLSLLIYRDSASKRELPPMAEGENRPIVGGPVPEVPKNPALTQGFATTTSFKPGEYISKVASLAIEADEVVMRDCEPDPLIVRVAGGKSVAFRNAGTSSISIAVNKAQPLVIEPGQTGSTARLNAGPQAQSRIAITYKCDSWNAGIIYVSNVSPAVR